MKKPKARIFESYAAVLITQGSYKFYSAALPIEPLANSCFVTTRDEDPDDGFQRLLDEDRAQNIADYIDNGGTIPTSVILSVQDDAEFEYDSKGKTIRFINAPKTFLVLDGQHRVWGFKLAKVKTLRVPVIIYAGLDRAEESRLFIDINTKQRPVPNELLLDIKKLADYETESEMYSGNLFDLFSKSRISVLKGKLSAAKRVKGLISRVTFYRALKPILSIITENPENVVFPVLNAYLQAVIWGLEEKKLPDSIVSPIVLGGFILLFPDITASIKNRHNRPDLTADIFAEALSPIFENVKSSYLKSPGNSSYKMYEELSKLLRNQKLRL